jgi:hypothetical protein
VARALASEINVVAAAGFWPRSLGRSELTAGDRAAMAQTRDTRPNLVDPVT